MRTPRFVLALIISMGILLPMAVAEETGLIPDDYVIAGVDGWLIEAKDGVWNFEFESATGRIKAGQSLELLRSAAFEKLTEDAKQRNDARYRLWGKVTKFEGKNYIFPAYFVGLRKADRPPAQPQQDAGTTGSQSINAPNDVLDIPDEIVARLATSEVLPSAEPQAELQLKQDTIFAGRTGFILAKDNRYVFEPDGLGRGIEKFSLELLPCQKLEDAITQTKPVRFSVAGVLTRYKDKQFLLLQKATRAYSYGNFGR